MAARWIPQDSVVGDFYALPEVADRYRGIVIGDAVGHGVSAAILMALITGAIRALSAVEHRPVELVSRVDQVLSELTRNAPGQRDVFLASMFYAQVDSQTRQVRYVNAGHPPPLLLRKGSGRVEQLPATGTLIGIDNVTVYEEAQLEVSRGDRLVLVTDGILEARNPAGEQFGLERVQATAEACHDVTAEACVDAIVWEAERFRDGEPTEDDQTVLVIDCLCC